MLQSFFKVTDSSKSDKQLPLMENSQAPQGIKDIQLSSKKRSIIRPECNILVIYQKSKNSVEGQSLEESIIEAYNKVITKPYLRNFDAKCLEFAQVGFSQDIDKTSEEYKNIAKLFKLMGMVLFISHIFACMWLFEARIN